MAFAGLGDVAQVGLVVLVQRSGNADDDGVHLGDVGVVGGGAEALACAPPGSRLAGMRHDVGAAGVERVHLAGVDVEAGDAEASAR